MKRSCVNYVTIAANSSVQDFTFVNSQDDYRARSVTGIEVSLHTENVQCNVVYQGRVYSSFDCNVLASLTEPLEVEFLAEPQQQPHIQFQDNTSTGAAAVAVTLFYEPTGAP